MESPRAPPNAAAAKKSDNLDGDDNTQPPRPNLAPIQKKKSRMRLDEAASLVAGSTVSRTVIQSWIARGKVLVDGVPVTKAGHSVTAKSVVEVRASEERFVCRGGLKLDAALAEFKIDVKGMRAIDCGLSTGGFADRLLQGGVEAVLGVDVGYGKFRVFFFALSLSFFSRSSTSTSVSAGLKQRRAPSSPRVLQFSLSFPLSQKKLKRETRFLFEEEGRKTQKNSTKNSKKLRPSRREGPDRPAPLLPREDQRQAARARDASRGSTEELRHSDARRQLHLGAQGEF